MNFKKVNYPSLYEEFERVYGKITAVCLCNAGIKSLNEADDYLYDLSMHNSEDIPDIKTAENIITDSIAKNEKICIFGDYDSDGVTSSAILYLTLSELGADTFVRLPDRKEGYGISIEAVRECINKGAKLIVTVDNGIRAIEEIKFAKENGIKVIVLDHHIPGNMVPNADCIIDLHWNQGNYPFKHLTGSGLAYKVSIYLLRNTDYDAYSLSDLAAIGTIADVETLLGENRIIVKHAIEQMRNANYKRYGVKALVQKELRYITAEDIAFQVGPCINACGRLDEKGAEIPLALLLATAKEEAEQIAKLIKERNEERKKIQLKCYKAIEKEVEECIAKNDKVIVVLSEDAPTGIVGLLAGNLKENYGRPAIVFGKKISDDGNIILTGSARSIDEYNILEGLEKCSECFLHFGGHALAAGMSILPDKLEELRVKLNKNADIPDEAFDKPFLYNEDIEIKDIENDSTYEALEACEPFGQGNPKPIFKVRVSTNPSKDGLFASLGKNKQHLKLKVGSFDIVGFNLVNKYESLNCPRTLNAFGTLSLNHFNGAAYKQFMMQTFEPIEEKKTDLMSSLSALLKF